MRNIEVRIEFSNGDVIADLLTEEEWRMILEWDWRSINIHVNEKICNYIINMNYVRKVTRILDEK